MEEARKPIGAYLQVRISSSALTPLPLYPHVWNVIYFFKSTAYFKVLWINENSQWYIFGMDINMEIILCDSLHHYFTWTILLDGRQHIDHRYSSFP
jgi:hypothetical protein